MSCLASGNTGEAYCSDDSDDSNGSDGGFRAKQR